MQSYCRVIVGATLGALTGCSGIQDQWGDRYGPPPILNGVTTGSVVDRQREVVDALVFGSDRSRRARIDYPEQWKDVILTGFNTVDDACQTYINDLWKLDRQKNRVKDIISASGAATAAIIGANANPSAKTLTVLAQAFGLASSLTGTLGDSYLFEQNPATVGQIVKKLQVAYREDFAKNFTKGNYLSDGYAAAYYHTREYLSLCLPPTIQSQIQDVLAKAKAGPEKATSTTTVTTPAGTTKIQQPDSQGKATTSVTLTPGI